MIRLSLHTSQVAHQAVAYPGFCSMKNLGAFLLPLDGMLVNRNQAVLSKSIAGCRMQLSLCSGSLPKSPYCRHSCKLGLSPLLRLNKLSANSSTLFIFWYFQLTYADIIFFDVFNNFLGKGKLEVPEEFSKFPKL